MNRAERVLVSRLIVETRDHGIHSDTADRLEALIDRQERPRAARPMLRRAPIRPASPKRRAEAPQRAAVRELVLARDGGCVPAARGMPGPCGSRPGRPSLEVHEIAARGTAPGSHLDPDLCVATCPAHHDQITEATGDLLALARDLDLRRRPTT